MNGEAKTARAFFPADSTNKNYTNAQAYLRIILIDGSSQSDNIFLDIEKFSLEKRLLLTILWEIAVLRRKHQEVYHENYDGYSR